MQGNNTGEATLRIFKLAIEVGLIFAIPAMLVGIFGPMIDRKMGTDEAWTIGLLIASLMISWIVVIYKYKKARKDLNLDKK